MKFQICIIYLYFFNKVFSASVRYDFRKYESYSTRDGHAIFDPTEFNNGDTMYFKVTASSFKSDSLGYEYLDEIPNAYSFTYDNNKRTVKSYHKVDGDDDDDDKESIRFYKIEKSQNELGSLKGTYLIFYFDCEGKVEIENTEKDEGKINLILTIVFSVVGLIIVGIIAYFCFCRKKKEVYEDDKKSNENNNNNNQHINNNEGNFPPQNYISQNGIYNNQNVNYNNNYAQNNNNFNNYNNNNVTVYNTGNNIYSRDNSNNNIMNNNNNNKYNNMIYNNQANNINAQYYSNTERVNVELTKPQNYNQNDIQYNVIPMNSATNRQIP
jgi:hypothetical protein